MTSVTSAPERPGQPGRPGARRAGRISRVTGLWRLVRETARSLRGHDLALLAAGLTFYSGIALVPGLLVTIRVVALVLGEAEVSAYGDRLATALPDRLGAPGPARALVSAGATLDPLTALIAVLPASVYGEGLRRSFARLAEHEESMTAWRGRLRVLPLLAVAPLGVLLVLMATPLLAALLGAGQTGRTALGVYVSFLLDWVALSVPLTYVYRLVGPLSPSWGSAAWGGFATGSVVSGFVQGFVLFLALPLDIGRPFGGFRVIGAVVAVGLWLWVLHAIVLVGYALTARVDARGGRPWGLPER